MRRIEPPWPACARPQPCAGRCPGPSRLIRLIRLIPLICLTGATLLGVPAPAAASAGPVPAAPPRPDCSAPDGLRTQADLNTCAFEGFTAASAAQTAALQALQSGLSPADRQRLQRAQQAHGAYAAAQCDFESGAVAGGSAQPMVKWQCLARLTRARAEALQAATQCVEGDLSCVRPQR